MSLRGGLERAALAASLAAALSACAGTQRPGSGEAGAERTPPFPLGSPEPHVEPDLVGATHVVQKGETAYRIARTYGIDPGELMEANGIADPRQLATGMELFVPGAPRPLEVPPLAGAPAASGGAAAGPSRGSAAAPAPEDVAPAQRWNGRMRWPLRGVLYRGFGVRQGQRHDGIDISAPEGTPVHAAAEGEVVFTGRQQGYGVLVIVRHEGSLVTLYAHNSAVLVKEGERVTAGTPIARVGQSGRTTGPHLHFEVREQLRDGYRPRNPLAYLPP